MQAIECRHCGNFTAHIHNRDNNGYHYDCDKCNYTWVVPHNKQKIRRILAILSFGLINAG